MKKKAMKMGIGAKLLVPSIAVIIIVCFLISSIITSRSKNTIIRVGGQVAQSVAMASTGKINLNQIESLLMAGDQASNTEQITTVMESVLESYDAINMYLIGYDKNTDSVYYALAAGNDTGYKFGDSYSHDSKYLSAVINDKSSMADDYMTKKSGVSVISAYAPIVKNDETIAILVCDYDASAISSEMNGNSMLAIVVSVICAIAGSLLIIVVVAAVVRNLNKVNSKVSELASNEGDLTQSIDIKSGDETELIAQNFNVLLEYIRTIMLAINGNADSLKNSSGEIVRNLGDARVNVKDISGSMESMGRAMQKTSDSIDEVAQKLQEMDEQIDGIRDKALDGSAATATINENANEIRKRAVEAKAQAKDKAQLMADSMKDKIEKSKEVEEIDTLTKQILAITNQTRLLSLNASIEAARAGELGRGFSVVAEEIGKLANESGEAAGKIQDVSNNVIKSVSELAAEAEKMISFLDEVTMAGYNELEDTSDMYSKDAKQLSVLMENFAKVSKRLKEYSSGIASTVEGVNVTAQETTLEISGVTDMTINMAEKISSIEEDAKNSESIAVELNSEVNKFKLN